MQYGQSYICSNSPLISKAKQLFRKLGKLYIVYHIETKFSLNNIFCAIFFTLILKTMLECENVTFA